ncbi:CGNR zinc finger domain-containing protein [Actinoalloteichus hymeniacidonis]|uniref:Conserved protein containing a Zn-ribbon-like motif n=1 Tax=Actinoalloteichus hymeniacidonis TaxID=340345 RepID=A0AAC9HPP2_9PSEU|nr:CGNR zinc finger domain-containing protein [Actinoalloteichus hymeniacidonis]AOS63297.1 conserved protein containing a Zn-ribbon-like motif [Actinoalloteichus hymeniacidonis]MBB5908664.1 putative RNA-binding Zn ribbon-like protein [Actinoalloteichus hymeniacidonis]
MAEPSRRALLVKEFANTLDVEAGTDRADSREGLAGWLIEMGLAAAGSIDVCESELRDFLVLRAGVRELLDAAGDPDPTLVAASDEVTRRLPMFVSLSSMLRPVVVEGEPAPEDAALDAVPAVDPATDLPRDFFFGVEAETLTADPTETAARRAMSAIAGAVATIRITGEIGRLTRCAALSCAMVFFDASKNHSRRWCSMRVCGNRAKARAYAARRREA